MAISFSQEQTLNRYVAVEHFRRNVCTGHIVCRLHEGHSHCCKPLTLPPAFSSRNASGAASYTSRKCERGLPAQPPVVQSVRCTSATYDHHITCDVTSE
jgi:hypothetical protein